MARSGPDPERLNAFDAALRRGDTATARSIAHDLVASHPHSPDAHYALALVQLDAGDEANGHASLQAALGLDPAHLPASLRMASFLRERGFAHQGMELTLRATQSHPRSVQAWMELGWCALDAHRIPGAIHAFTESVRLAPGDASAHSALARAHASAFDFPAAENGLRKAMELRPREASFVLALAMRLRQQGRSREALDLIEALPAEDRDSAPALELRTGTLADLDRAPEALELARLLGSMHPGYLPGLQLLAQMEWEYGTGLAAAGDAWAQRAFTRPDDFALAFARIGFLQASRQHDAALQLLDKLARRLPDHPDIDLLRAYSLDESGNHPGAGELLARIEARYCGRVAFLNQWARNRLRARDASAAEQLAQRAIGLDPDNQEAIAYLGTAWRLLDDPREQRLCDYDRFIGIIDVESRNPDLFASLQPALEELHRSHREPLQQSVRGGQQTTGRLFASHRAQSIRDLQPLLVGLVQEWLAQLPADAAHPFLRRNTGRVAMSGSWSVRLGSGGSHVNHIHNEGWISSALYVSLPPSIQHEDNPSHAGWLQFGQPPAELGLEFPPRRVIRPEVGKLVLFPSYLWHGTVPFIDDDARLTIAFDMVPRSR